MNEQRVKELMQYFRNNGIRNDLKQTIEYQDLIGRSTNIEIADFYSKLDHFEKQIFIWVCMNTISFEMSITIIKESIIKPFKQKCINDIELEYQDRSIQLAQKEQELIQKEILLKEIERKQQEILKILNS
jgi:hypothetical protein